MRNSIAHESGYAGYLKNWLRVSLLPVSLRPLTLNLTHPKSPNLRLKLVSFLGIGGSPRIACFGPRAAYNPKPF